jgi:hypothetical protein
MQSIWSIAEFPFLLITLSLTVLSYYSPFLQFDRQYYPFQPFFIYVPLILLTILASSSFDLHIHFSYALPVTDYLIIEVNSFIFWVPQRFARAYPFTLKFLVLNSNLQPLVEAINTLVAVAVIDISSSMTPSHSSSAFLQADLTYFRASSSPYC